MEDVIQTGGNVVIGAAAVLLAPLVISGLARFSRPLAKTTLKGGLIAWERIKELSAETKEDFEDLSAEVKADMREAVAATGTKEKEVPKTAAKTSSSAKKGTAAENSAAREKPAAKTSPSRKTQAKTASVQSDQGRTGEKKESRPPEARVPEKAESKGDSNSESNQAHAAENMTAEKKPTDANAANQGSTETKTDQAATGPPPSSPKSPMTGDSTPSIDSSKREGN